MNCIYFVIPCYNEQEVLPITAEQLRIKYDQLLQRADCGEQPDSLGG